jgi:alkylation response protein AidB-like acyl-CoA dehydrogenase
MKIGLPAASSPRRPKPKEVVMNFGFTEEQELLRDQVRRFMVDACPMPQARTVMKGATGTSAALWRQAADLGWLGLVIPERFGGVGLKWVDLTVVLEETGRGLSPLPIVSQTLAAAALLRCGTSDQQQRLLPQLANGSIAATLALYDEPNWIHLDAITLVLNGGRLRGTKPFVADAAAADLFVVACRNGAELSLALIERTAPGVSIAVQPLVDEAKRVGTLSLDVAIDAAHLMPLSGADLTFLADCGAVAITAESVGAAEAALAMTTAYAKERIQFGSPIGKYQGVKHRLAEMFVDIESFKSLLYYAAWTVDDAPAELPRAASLAKAYASDAFSRIGIDGVQLHGAIGFTAEYDIQLYLKRSKWARPMYGDSDYHYERVAALGGL